MLSRDRKRKLVVAPFLVIERFFSRRNRKPAGLSGLKKALIVEIWGIGDLAMMTSVIGPLRKSFPEASFDLLCKPLARNILAGQGFFSEFICFDFPWTRFHGKYRIWNWDWLGIIRLIMRLRKARYDLIIDARGDPRNNLLSFLINARRRLGYDWSGGGIFLTDVLGLDYRDKHRVEAWLNILDYLKLDISEARPKLCVTQKSRKQAEELLNGFGITKENLLVGIHPGARIKTRRWDIKKFARVAEYARDKYKARIIVFVEPQGYGEDIPIEGDFLKLKCSLDNLAAVIKRLNLLVCNDGGPMHIAAALEVPVIGVFGPTNPVKFGPYSDNSTVIIDNSFSCRPCFDYCSYPEALCLAGIDAREVMAKMDKYFGGHSRGNNQYA
ncbi:MAG: glycosyltransferase family 9 protein [Candidatus Omnitrophota bacterium]